MACGGRSGLTRAPCASGRRGLIRGRRRLGDCRGCAGLRLDQGVGDGPERASDGVGHGLDYPRDAGREPGEQRWLAVGRGVRLLCGER